MPYNTDTAAELDRVDRILLAACAAIWLAALGAAVAATVALVDLGSGHAQASSGSDTPWLLYTVIGVSAAVIIGAVPLLLRARRAALEESPPARAPLRSSPGQPAPPVRGVDAPTEKLRVPGGADPVGARPGYPRQREALRATPSPVMAAVDQLWLRCAVGIACAIGVATVAIAIATYLMAVDSDVASWVFYGLAALVTIAMPAVPWYFLRELRELVETPSSSERE